MAATATPTAKNGKTVMLTEIDANWSTATYVGATGAFFPLLTSFYPGAAGDCIVLQDSDGIDWVFKSLDGTPQVLPFPGDRYDFVVKYDHALTSLSAGHKLSIMYRFR